MSNNHEEWLKEQGARVVRTQPLYRPFLNRMPVGYATDHSEDIAPVIGTVVDYVYHIEVSLVTVDHWMRSNRQLEKLYALSQSYNSTLLAEHKKNMQRHQKLLEENPMYREAWSEFQSIRALLGEDNTLWP